MKNKIVTDNDRIKQLETSNKELQDVLDGCLAENEQLKNTLSNTLDYEARIETENDNLLHLMKYHSLIMLLMGVMEHYCDDDTCIGTAFKLAIRRYQHAVLDRIPLFDDVTPYDVDDNEDNMEEIEDEEKE